MTKVVSTVASAIGDGVLRINRPSRADNSYQAESRSGECATDPAGNDSRRGLLRLMEVTVRMLVQIVLVAFGSALGGLARWGVGLAAARWFGTAWPWGTFVINVSGCLFLGWFSTLLSDRLLQGAG